MHQNAAISVSPSLRLSQRSSCRRGSMAHSAGKRLAEEPRRMALRTCHSVWLVSRPFFNPGGIQLLGMLIAAGVMPTPSCCTAPARVWCGWRRRHGIALRQSSARVGKIALIPYQRYAHAKPFKRAAKALRRLRTMLGRVIRDITRKTAPRPELAEVFALPLALARRVRDQRQRERGRKSLPLGSIEGLQPARPRGGVHPRVKPEAKGKAHKPYEFGVKVSVATPLHRCRGGTVRGARESAAREPV